MIIYDKSIVSICQIDWIGLTFCRFFEFSFLSAGEHTGCAKAPAPVAVMLLDMSGMITVSTQKHKETGGISRRKVSLDRIRFHIYTKSELMILRT